MKNFLVSLVLSLTLILPNIAQADSLDDFKNILASKHFFIKYTSQKDGDGYIPKTGKGFLLKDKKNTQIIDGMNNLTAPHKNFEAYDGNNYYIENDSHMCHLKIDDKAFRLMKTEIKGKVTYSSFGRNNKIATYTKTDEEFNFGLKSEPNSAAVQIGANFTDLTPAIMALLTKENDVSPGVYFYKCAGHGTTEDGLEYFDLKADTLTDDLLVAVRYCFKDGVIKQIITASYYKNLETGQTQMQRTTIDVEEFNTNPDQKYFKLPDNFKEVKEQKQHNEEVMEQWEKKTKRPKFGIGPFRIG